MLLPEHGQGRLVVDVARVQVGLELGQLLLSTGIESDLGRDSIYSGSVSRVLSERSSCRKDHLCNIGVTKG